MLSFPLFHDPIILFLFQSQSKFRPSNEYFSWEKANSTPVWGGDKILSELIRSAATSAGLGDAKITQLVGMSNPVVDLEGARNLQSQYKSQLMKDLMKKVKDDGHFSADKYPDLTRVMNL